MTAYLRAAYACRAVAVLALAATVWLFVIGSPWWACALTGWVTFLAVLLGGRCHVGHHNTLTLRERNRA